MAFFKFGLAQESGVDALLDKWEQEIGSPSTSPASPRNLPASPTSAEAARQAALDAASPSIEVVGDERASGIPQTSASNGRAPGKPTLTLEQLLEEDDLLQECKNSHSKLLDFLSMPHTVRKMLDYASGEAFDSIPALAIPPSLDSSHTEAQVDPPSAASTAKPPASGPNPSLAEQARLVLSPKISPMEREQNRKRIKYPYLCTEILTLDLWPISDTIFNDTDRFLLPFWNAILDKQPLELAEISVHAGHWSKINIQWLSHGRVPQFLRFLKTIPQLFPRMLAHLPYISPIFDVLVKLVNTDDTHPRLEITDWLHKSRLVPQVLSLLDPQKSPIEAHAPASEFLRSIIAAASAASAAKQQQQQQESAKLGEINGDSLGLPPLSSAAWSNWPNNTLVRELASQETMDQLLGYVLDHKVYETDGSKQTPPDDEEGETDAGASQVDTAQHGEKPSRNAITSSLLNSLTIIIDLIRKNNSDFTELQIFHFLERTVGGSESGSVQYGLEGEGEEGVAIQDHGPSLVDLEPLLRTVTRRLPELHQLLTAPRSDVSPVPTTLQGLEAVEPLTFERFRICELYAELLHCSNMAILNRASTSSNGSEHAIPIYDSVTGRIQGPREEAYGRLSRVLNGSPDVSPSTSATQIIASKGPSEETGEPGSGDASLNNRPVTAESIATSSYDSEADTVLDNKSNDHDDVFDQINVAADDLSLSESGSQKAPSAVSSPMPPSTGTFSSEHTSIPTHTSQQQENTAQDSTSAPPASAGRQLPPGPALKQAFIELEVIPTVLDLFFKFPWNNFLHNVVYDLIQQIFNGKTDDDMNRQLCAAVFMQRKGLVARILDAVEENNAAVKRPHGVRLGHMGHLTLISEEVVKLFYEHADWILPLLPEDAFDNAEWEAYIDNTFRETRERDLQQLGGGISLGMHASTSTGSGGHGIIEMDDEFPPTGGRGLYANDQSGSPETSPDKSHFARYLASQISSDYQETTPQHNALNRSTSSSSSSGSSSSDDINEDSHVSQSRRQGPKGAGSDNAASTWFNAREGDSAFDDYDDEGDISGGTFGGKHRWHSDFDISVDTPAAYSQTRKIHDSTAGPGRQDRFGFDDRFDSLDPTQFGTGDSDDDDDDEFGPFSDTYAAQPSPGAAMATVKGYSFDDDFGQVQSERSAVTSREKLTPADWNSSFRSNYDEITPSFGEFGDFSNTAESPMASPSGEFHVEDDDDFGDFASGEANNHGDYDFTLTDEPAASGPAVGTPTKSSPVAPRTEASPSPSPSRRPPPSVPPKRRSVSVSSLEQPPGPPAVTSPGMKIQGPGVHEGTHISRDGVHLETEIEVDGEKVIVQVPKDELALHPDFAEQ